METIAITKPTENAMYRNPEFGKTSEISDMNDLASVQD